MKKDLEKRHHHESKKLKGLYFALPDYLNKHHNLVPERAGILDVYERYGSFRVRKIRDAKASKGPHKFSVEERAKIGRLASMRIWTLKRRIQDMRREIMAEKSSILEKFLEYLKGLTPEEYAKAVEEIEKKRPTKLDCVGIPSDAEKGKIGTTE